MKRDWTRSQPSRGPSTSIIGRRCIPRPVVSRERVTQTVADEEKRDGRGKRKERTIKGRGERSEMEKREGTY